MTGLMNFLYKTVFVCQYMYICMCIVIVDYCVAMATLIGTRLFQFFDLIKRKQLASRPYDPGHV